MSAPRWALDLTAPRSEGYDIAEALGFDELQDALSVSVFDAGPGTVAVQALYASEGEAKAAAAPYTSATVSQLPDTDWVSEVQSGLPPIEAGRFVVHGSHDTPPTDGRLGILVDAGAAFGTGHHGTTQGCLLMISEMADRPHPARVLDLGTGAGVLAIAAAKAFPDADILATDIDADAVAVARDNARLNGVDFACVQADGFDAPELRGATFDLVIANILAGPLAGMAAEIAAATAPGGSVVLSGILDAQADWVAKAFTAQGLQIQKRPSLDGWTSLLGTKPEVWLC